MRATSDSRDLHAGFTLIELLVVIAIAARATQTNPGLITRPLRSWKPLSARKGTAMSLASQALAILADLRDRVREVLRMNGGVVVERLSTAAFTTPPDLLPGDVISTGTPPGVGLGLDPPVFLKAGDVVECGIEKLGQQRQRIVGFLVQVLAQHVLGVTRAAFR